MDATEQNQSTNERRRPTIPEVVAVLDRHRDEIAAVWALLGLKTLHPPEILGFPERKVRSARVLCGISEALLTDSYLALDQYVSESATWFSPQGIDIGSHILTWAQGRTATLEVLRRAYPTGADLILECVTQVDHCLTYCTALYGRQYVEKANRHLFQQQAQTRWMLDAARTASPNLDLDEVLAHTAKILTSALGLPHCMVMLVDEDRETISVRRAGITEASALELNLGRRLSEGSWSYSDVSEFSLQVLRQKQPRIAHDSRLDSRFEAGLGSKSLLGLPFVVNDRVVAMAWILTWDDYYDFGADEIDLAQGIANVAAMAIDNAHLHQQVKEQAICEERERLAQEMHDDLSQSLATINWRAATLDRLLANGDVDGARARLQELKEIAKQGYADVRESIFTLRSASSVESEFLPTLELYLAEYRDHTGLDVELAVDVPSFPQFPVEVRLQLIRIIQESLANVHKHARASWVRLAFHTSDGLTLKIEDNGCGFDLAQAQDEKNRYGLAIMGERASSVGGSLSIESLPGQGTRLFLWLPLPPGERRTL